MRKGGSIMSVCVVVMRDGVLIELCKLTREELEEVADQSEQLLEQVEDCLEGGEK